MQQECSFAGASSTRKASWFHYPLGPNNVTYASFNFLILLQFYFFWTIFSCKTAFRDSGYSVIPRLKIFRRSTDPPFLCYIILLYNSRYRISQLARFANLAALFGIIIIIIIIIIIMMMIIIILNKIIWYYQLS